MKNWTKILFRNLSFVGLAFGSVLLFLAVNQYNLTTKLNHINILHEGIQTCFYRTYQTFTAKLLGLASSQYLESSFVDNTEACFGDVIDETRADFADSLKAVIQEMNQLAGDVHWFHKSLGENKNFAKPVDESRSLGRRFENIEAKKERLTSKLEIFRSANLEKLVWFRNLFFVLTLGLFLAIAIELFLQKRRAKLRALMNQMAIEESKNSEFPRSVMIEEIIQKTLKENHQEDVGDLFNKYHEYILDGKLDIFKLSSTDEKTQAPTPEEKIPTVDLELKAHKSQNKVESEPIRSEVKMLSTKMKATLEEKIEEEAVTPCISMDNVLSNVISVLSNHLFKEGILFDVKLSSGLFISGRADDATQIIYNLLSMAIASVSKNSEERKIIVSGKADRKDILLELFYNAEEERFSMGAERFADYEVCKHLIQDMGGEIRSFPKLDRLGKSEGTTIQLSFKVSQNQTNIKSKAIKKVLKGTKKEILKQLGQSIV